MYIRASGLFILGLLRETVSEMSDDAFTATPESLSGATPGQHIRHIIEFFTCLRRGCDEGVVNYDRRAHDHDLETSRELALQAISKLENFLRQTTEEKWLELETSMDPHRDDWVRVPSSFSRELAYTIDHAIHHMAIIKPALRELVPSLILDPAFGVAFSTMRHRAVVASEQPNA